MRRRVLLRPGDGARGITPFRFDLQIRPSFAGNFVAQFGQQSRRFAPQVQFVQSFGWRESQTANDPTQTNHPAVRTQGRQARSVFDVGQRCKQTAFEASHAFFAQRFFCAMLMRWRAAALHL